MNAIETYDLTKNYAEVVAVDQINLNIPVGSVFGIVGEHGCGKTTLLRLLSTLTAPSGGDALVAGTLITGNLSRVRHNIGYMPHEYGLYSHITVEEYMRFFAASYGIKRSDQNLLVHDLLQLVDLSHKRTEQVNHLTPSMRQRLNLARTLVHDPQILLMDEPVSRLDPRTHLEMRELIKELRSLGKTLVVTSRIVADLAGMCTHIAILERGRVVISGSFTAICDRLHHNRTIIVKFFGDVGQAIEIAKAARGTTNVEVVRGGHNVADAPSGNYQSEPVVTILKELHVGFDGDFENASDLLRTLMRMGVQVVAFTEQDDTAHSLLIQHHVDHDHNTQEVM